MTDSASIADRIKLVAKQRQIKLSELLESCGLSKNALSSMTAGSMPKADNLAKIAERLGVSVDYLLDSQPAEKDPGTVIVDDEDLKFALFGSVDIDDDVLEDVRAYASFAKQRKKSK